MLDRGRGGFGCKRQFHDEARAYRTIFFDADRAVMIFNDAADDRETESGAAFLGREIRQE
jgi:hypothetical protein